MRLCGLKNIRNLKEINSHWLTFPYSLPLLPILWLIPHLFSSAAFRMSFHENVPPYLLCFAAFVTFSCCVFPGHSHLYFCYFWLRRYSRELIISGWFSYLFSYLSILCGLSHNDSVLLLFIFSLVAFFLTVLVFLFATSSFLHVQESWFPVISLFYISFLSLSCGLSHILEHDRYKFSIHNVDTLTDFSKEIL